METRSLHCLQSRKSGSGEGLAGLLLCSLSRRISFADSGGCDVFTLSAGVYLHLLESESKTDVIEAHKEIMRLLVRAGSLRPWHNNDIVEGISPFKLFDKCCVCPTLCY